MAYAIDTSRIDKYDVGMARLASRCHSGFIASATRVVAPDAPHHIPERGNRRLNRNFK